MPDESGRPTRQREMVDAPHDGPRRPRFQDRPPEAFRHPDANPYLHTHRAFGRPLIPADEAWTLRGRWAEEFGREAPLHLEIGSGNGFFLAGLAGLQPAWNLVGVEIRYKRTVMVAKKLVEAGAEHARICRYDATCLDDLFEPGSLAGIYVNHPDPWPKARHEKNRLISRWFLEDVVRLLRPGGHFRLKSDHRPNVDRAVHLLDHGPDDEALPHLPLRVSVRSDDVNAGGPAWSDDVVTNYQRKFLERGEPVYALEFLRTADDAADPHPPTGPVG